MIDAMPSETCSAQKAPTSGRSSLEQRSPRRAPYSVPSSDSSSSLHSNHSRHSSNSNNNNNINNPIDSRQRPSSHRSLPSFSKLAASSTNNIANKSTSNGPTIARQHVHAVVPVVNSDQDSVTRLANTAQSAIRSTAPQSKTSEEEALPRQELTRKLSNSLNGLHVYSKQGGSGEQVKQSEFSELSPSSTSDSSRSRSESVTSSLATSVSDGQGLGVSLTGSQSAFKQHQKALRNANGVQTSNTVASQPPAPPENARGRSLGQGDNDARKEQYSHHTSTKQQDTTPNHNSNANDFQQIPPTIEQRDALATRVYAACQAAGYDEWVRLLDLAPLASQHHLSGYNCIKFGQDGSPYAYLPLSLQQPAQVQEVLQKQKINEGKASEWLTHKRRNQGKSALGERSASQSNSNSNASSSDPSTPSSSTDSQNKVPRLMSKGDENGDVRMRNASPAPASKEKCKACQEMAQGSNDLSPVCECGPLKNEAALSSEWEAPIGKEVCKDTTEAGQNGHPNQSSAQPNSLSVKTSDTHPISISPIIPPELLEEISKHVLQAMPETLRQSKVNLFDSDGIHEKRHDDLQVHGKRLIRCRLTHVDMCEIAFKAERELIEASQSQRKPRSLRLCQPFIQEPPPSVVREAIMLDSKQPILVDRGVYCQTTFDNSDSEQDGEECHLNGLHSDVQLSQDPNPPSEDNNPFVMGNLLLSSCPGKKVRLTGPVRGRGAICRDLGLDLMRIRQLGVGAIVCCLDDEELLFLGAPWSQYEAEADKLGIEVIRLPMAEGFSPTDVLATDKAISCVVNDYTLHGVHVLVHCRGGVGRAGLIACTWMLKLGLVRSDRDEVRFRIPTESLSSMSPPNNTSFHPLTNWQNGGMIGDHQEKITMDIMQTIHRLIETIRRRRSPKAIETAEQVDFLVKVSNFMRVFSAAKLKLTKCLSFFRKQYLLYLHEQERKHLCNCARLQSAAT